MSFPACFLHLPWESMWYGWCTGASTSATLSWLLVLTPNTALQPWVLLLCPESCCSLESFDGLLLCVGDHRTLCWPELNAGSSVLAFLEHIYKEPCPCFQPVPLAMAAQHLEVCGWPPLSFTAGRGSPPQLEAVGRRWLLELQKSCFSVMGCTTSAVIKNPAAQAPSLPFSSVPLLLP